MGGVESDVIEIGSRGTPQGSVLSPFLFNAVMIGLPRILDSIEGLEHSLYADDITIWSSGGGSDGEIQERLQKAADAVVEYAAPKGLRCSLQTSELPSFYNIILESKQRARWKQLSEVLRLSSGPRD